MQLEAKDVAFWTEIDIEYEGDALLGYQIELVQNGATVAVATCNPLGSIPSKVGWLETNFGNSHSRRGSGKMTCATKLPGGGLTRVRATLAFDKKPSVLRLLKADLLVQQ